MAPQVLGTAVDHHVGPQVQGLRQAGSSECIIYQQGRPVPMRHAGQRWHVCHLEQRVGDGLD